MLQNVCTAGKQNTMTLGTHPHFETRHLHKFYRRQVRSSTLGVLCAFILKCEVTIEERSGRTNFRVDIETSYSLLHLCRYESCRNAKKNHDLCIEKDFITSII
jgi:hypothetical protein